jgi:FixJ family two-component response regulator
MLDDAIVHVVDDDQGMRQSIEDLLRSVGYAVRLYARAEEFLAATLPNGPACVIIDVRMPGPSGLELQAALAERNGRLPIILMSGHGDIRMTVRAIKAGAVDFIEKPFRDQDMLEAVAAAIRLWKPEAAASEVVADLRRRYESLTSREREVMTLVCKGCMNKQIAGELDIQPTTVKFHRSAVMTKMKAGSLAELTRMAALLEAPSQARQCTCPNGQGHARP